MPLISYTTKVVCVERYFEIGMIKHGKVGSVCVLDERAIALADSVIVMGPSGTIEEVCKTCETVSMVEGYSGSGDNLFMRRVLAVSNVLETLSKLCGKVCRSLKSIMLRYRECSSLALTGGRRNGWLVRGGVF